MRRPLSGLLAARLAGPAVAHVPSETGEPERGAGRTHAAEAWRMTSGAPARSSFPGLRGVLHIPDRRAAMAPSGPLKQG